MTSFLTSLISQLTAQLSPLLNPLVAVQPLVDVVARIRAGIYEPIVMWFLVAVNLGCVALYKRNFKLIKIVGWCLAPVLALVWLLPPANQQWWTAAFFATTAALLNSFKLSRARK